MRPYLTQLPHLFKHVIPIHPNWDAPPPPHPSILLPQPSFQKLLHIRLGPGSKAGAGSKGGSSGSHGMRIDAHKPDPQQKHLGPLAGPEYYKDKKPYRSWYLNHR